MTEEDQEGKTEITFYLSTQRMIPGYIRQLINNWYYKADTENHDFDKFIALWISFNAFYANHSSEDRERDQLRKVVEDFKLAFIQWPIDNDILKFHKYINDRKVYGFGDIHRWLLNILCYKRNEENIWWSATENDLTNSNKFELNGQWIRVKGATGSTNMLIWHYNTESDLQALINVLYQIRCNLFHGNKNPSEEADQAVMEKAVPALRAFLTRLYTDQDILKPKEHPWH